LSHLLSREIDFLLFEVLDAEGLSAHDRYRDFTRETITDMLLATEKLADTYFAPFYRKGDEEEPRFVDGRADVIPEVKAAWAAVAEAGLHAAHHDGRWGGAQIPSLVQHACLAHLFGANISFAAFSFLTIGAANLIRSFGDPVQQATFLPPLLNGRFSGTMALSEPGQGSALADIKTTAMRSADGNYRLRGSKMFISAGDHEVTENIVHLVLAKIPGAPDGVKGISLFICPKFMVKADGSLGARNDVVLTGLLHKMGYRQIPSTVLSFGADNRCTAYLVGEANCGLDYMFQMMNEARINVALGSAVLGLQGFAASLNYARERSQGRLPSDNNPSSLQIPIVQHSDVKRMLLAQKSYAEGSLALCLYASRLVDEHKTHPDPTRAEQAGLLLDFLTPIAKSFSSEYGVRANDLAIQVFGGAGYIREFPVEQYYRDNRLNPIHEGTTGVQALDLLGRKLRARQGASFTLFLRAIDATIDAAARVPALDSKASQLRAARLLIQNVSAHLISAIATDSDLGLANATLYLDLAGRVTIAWIWLQQALAADRLSSAAALPANRRAYLQGKLQTATYYFEWELPVISHLAHLLTAQSRVCFDMQEEWF
jgi:alkylation response protein AidB-like acyl-CoA dehydrogenase